MAACSCLNFFLYVHEETNSGNSSGNNRHIGTHSKYNTHVSLLFLSDRGGGCVRGECVSVCDSNGGAAETAFTLHVGRIPIPGPGSWEEHRTRRHKEILQVRHSGGTWKDCYNITHKNSGEIALNLFYFILLYSRGIVLVNTNFLVLRTFEFSIKSTRGWQNIFLTSSVCSG